MPQTPEVEEEPRVFPGRSGWLAVSKPGSTFVVAVIGSSEADALQRFREEIAAWRRLRTARLQADGGGSSSAA
jgi:hypothetical protein